MTPADRLAWEAGVTVVQSEGYCPTCWGSGWYCESNEAGDDYVEKYCECPAGRARKEREK